MCRWSWGSNKPLSLQKHHILPGLWWTGFTKAIITEAYDILQGIPGPHFYAWINLFVLILKNWILIIQPFQTVAAGSWFMDIWFQIIKAMRWTLKSSRSKTNRRKPTYYLQPLFTTEWRRWHAPWRRVDLIRWLWNDKSKSKTTAPPPTRCTSSQVEEPSLPLGSSNPILQIQLQWL